MTSYKKTVLFEIILVLSMSISMSYFIHEADKNRVPLWENNDFKLGKVIFQVYSVFVKLVIGTSGIVSAEQLAIQTCTLSKTGAICQEYTALSACQTNCNTTCIPTSRKQVAQCKLGTCYDKTEGTCQARSPKQACESGSGVWYDDENGNIPICKKGCCMVGEQTFFSTAQECARKGSVLGMAKVFKPEVRTELECLVLSNSKEEGACVFDQDFEKTCKFTSKQSCLTMKGEFHGGTLCSHPDLKTNCEKQKTAKCVDGKDEIYWFDSCGNKENIYDSNKVKSFNNGKILSKAESCSIGSLNSPLANQQSCGNCNYLFGSRCVAKSSNEKLADSTKDFVCKDLRCKDGNGNIKLNGESWCAYTGTIGLDVGSKGFPRSVDTPGSKNFRQVCVNGEVRTDPCADYRNEICVESDTPLPNGKVFASAACRLNGWQLCMQYNSEVKAKKGSERKAQEETRNEKCNKNPDCFIKNVKVSDTFKFEMCAPKYPAGFDLSANGESANQICSQANQKCTVLYVKGLGGWDCKANCECEKAVFTQQMNDLCMSLGDCGAKVNSIGDLSQNYKVKNAPKLKADYLSGIQKYATPVKGKVAEPGNLSALYGEIGEVDQFGNPGKSPESNYNQLGMIAGGAGAAILAIGWLVGPTMTVATYGIAVSSAGLVGGTSLAVTNAAGSAAATAGGSAAGSTAGGLAGIYSSLGASTTLAPVLAALTGALAGAAIGVAVVGLLLQFTGVGAGLPPAVAYALMAAGAFGGATVGAAVLGGASAATGAAGATGVGGALGSMAGALASLAPIGIIVIAAVIVIIVIMKLLGIGKTKKIKVSFTCQPWQPVNGGAKCNQCGKDLGNSFGVKSLPCSKYQCESLGQTCSFINEGTGEEQCIDINPNDAAAPRISPLQQALLPGYSYQNPSEDGVTIKGPEECVKAYSPLILGIQVNEPGQCKMDVQHTNSFDDMEFDFGGNSLYKMNHTMAFSVPSLESLGLPGFDPNKRADYSLYVRCQDKRGNKNVKEYAVNFCIKPGDDTTPPIVLLRDPPSEYVPFIAENVNASIVVNEPSECRYSELDQDYDTMTNQMECATELDDMEGFGWTCNADFPLNTTGTNSYFVRCKDQPWLVEDSGSGAKIVVNEGEDENGNPITREVEVPAGRKRNKNMEGFEMKFIKSENPLSIVHLSPDNTTLIYGVQPVSVRLEAGTSGGVDGRAICSYQWGGQYIPFINTFETTHTQVFESFSSGDKVIPVRCEDIAGNVAERTARFRIEMDTSSPVVTRVYEQSGNLVVITNENAKCYLSQSKCDFDIANASLMNGEELVHTFGYQRSRVSFIKCKDQFDNTPGSCLIDVRGGI